MAQLGDSRGFSAGVVLHLGRLATQVEEGEKKSWRAQEYLHPHIAEPYNKDLRHMLRHGG